MKDLSKDKTKASQSHLPGSKIPSQSAERSQQSFGNAGGTAKAPLVNKQHIPGKREDADKWGSRK